MHRIDAKPVHALARLHHRRDLTYRTVTDAPQSQIGLAWLEVETTDLMEELIGIVRGRTPNSTRGRSTRAPEPERKPEPKPRKPQPKPARSGAPRPAKRGRPRRRS